MSREIQLPGKEVLKAVGTFQLAFLLLFANGIEGKSAQAIDTQTTPAETPTAVINTESVITGENFSITNVPQEVDATRLRFGEGGIGETEFTSEFAGGLFLPQVAQPGVYTTSDPNNKDIVSNDNPDGSAYLLAGAFQTDLNSDIETHIVAEGRGTTMLTGAGFKIELDTGEVLDFNAEENHTWIVLLRGREKDGETPSDRNVLARISEYTPGAVRRTNLPPGMFVSSDYLAQNVATAHDRDNCGRDGCNRVSVAIYDLEEGTLTIATSELIIEGNRTKETWKVLAQNWERPSN